MKISCCSFEELAKAILANEKKIVMFGAGVIGQITTPEILKEYNILQYLDCYLDNDKEKWGDFVELESGKYEIKSPEYLSQCTRNTVILINISRFAEVKDQLDKMECTYNMTAYIMPMMCIHNMCSNESGGSPVLSAKPLIPKIIHYMWLGGNPIPDNLKKCIDSWRDVCPDYEIIEWNESNYDINKHPYMKQAYENKAYGFVPDYARLDILYNYGGFYLDTDVQLLKSLDLLRNQEAFVGVEKWLVLNFGGCSGAVKGHHMIKKFLDARQNIFYIDHDGNPNRNTCGYYDTRVAIGEGYELNGDTQCVNGMNIYGYDYFQPYDYMSGILNETVNTRSIHYFNGGWLDDNMKKQNEITKQKYTKLYEECLER